LIDCGEGTQMQLRKARIRLSSINNIFISHLHGDHIFGLYGLLSTLSLLGRKSPVNLYAPEAFEAILKVHLSDFDIHLSFEINFIPLRSKDPVTVLSDKHVTVTAFPLKHRIPTFGFLFREAPRERNIRKEALAMYQIPVHKILSIKKGSDLELPNGETVPNDLITFPPPEPVSYAYCSDTQYFKKLSALVKGVTVLYHEATFSAGEKELAVKTGHSTSDQAAAVARDAGAKKLLIGHFSARYKDTGILEKEARSVFPETYCVTEGRYYDISNLDTF
jgi:ribonuclease Z